MAKLSFNYITPIGYPGGKRLSLPSILPYIPHNVKVLVSPFIGGASIELACLKRGISVYGYDLFEPIVEFWQELRSNKEKLTNEILSWHPMNQEKFTYLLEKSREFPNRTQRAAAYYIINKNTFSGFAYQRKNILQYGMKVRFAPHSINKLRFYNLNKLIVRKSHWEDTLSRHDNEFFYCDPPYYFSNMSRANMYGFNGELHREFNHEKFAEAIQKKEFWLISYNNEPYINELYKNCVQIPVSWRYSMSTVNRNYCNELLIISDKTYEQYQQNMLL